MDGIATYDFARKKYGRQLAVDSGRVETLPGFVRDSRPHRLAFHEIMLIERGTGIICVDAIEIPVCGPMVAMFAPGQLRCFHLQQRIEGPVVMFAADAADRLISFVPAGMAGPGAAAISADLSARVADVARTMAGEIAALPSDLPRMLEALLAQMLLLIGRQNCAESPKTGLVARLMQLIEARFRVEHRASAYAEDLGISTDHLSAVVRRCGGGSIRALIERRIHEEAKRLLRNSGLSVAEIGFSLGYQDASHFSRAFRRAVEVSPAEFRRKIAEAYR